MSEIIIDCGAAGICKNSRELVERIVDEVADADKGRNIVYLKWQLFEKPPPGSYEELMPLSHTIFDFAFQYAAKRGYSTTASFFDDWSLGFLKLYDTPWLKIACREYLYKYIPEINDRRLMVSVPSPIKMDELREKYDADMSFLMCVPEYPAATCAYESLFGGNLSIGISDHSPDLHLFKKWRPWYYERHFKLEDSEGLDAGPWASTAKQLKEIL